MAKAGSGDGTPTEPDDGAKALAEAAEAGLSAVPDQTGADPQLEGMDYAKVRFVGVQYDTLEDTPKMGEEVTFIVRGKVVGHGEEMMADGHIRQFAKVKVSSVAPGGDK